MNSRQLHELDGKLMNLDQLANVAAVCRRSLETRLENGWPVKTAVTLPADTVLLGGEPATILAIARAEGVPVNVLRAYLGGSAEADEAVQAVRRDLAAGTLPPSRGRRARPRRLVEYQGRTWTVAELARHLGMKYITLSMRLRKGWPVEKAVSEDVRRWRTYEYNGRQLSMRQLAAETGLPHSLLSSRLAKGMSVESAVRLGAEPSPRNRGSFTGVKVVEYNGRWVSVSELARRFNVSYPTLMRRLFKDGMPVEKALSVPTRRRARYTCNGEQVTVAEVARRLGVCQGTVYLHLREGWSMERIVDEYTRP